MDWLSVAEIARLTRIPAPTARRYAALFREFLPHRKVGRVTRYAPDSARVFERISGLYHEGRVTTEIEEVLRREFSRTIDLDAAGTGEARLPEPAPGVLDQFNTSLQVIADQRAVIEALREDVRKLKAGFVLLARGQKRLKALPAAGGDDLSRTAAALARKDSELEELALGLSFDTSDMKIKLQTLEQELVRLRKDRREMERHLLDKLERLKPS
jgi:hypothetical protein